MAEVQLDVLQSRLAGLGRTHTPVDVAAALRGMGVIVTDAVVHDVLAQLRRNSVGAGPLDDLLAEPGVSDVVVNGPREVFVDRGRGLERAEVRFVDDEQVRRLAIRLAAAAGRRLDDSSPFVDGRLPGGVRLHAVLAPVAAPGTCLSLRVPARRSFSVADLVADGSLPPEGERLLRAVVAARLPFLISGGTGTGKTTLLSALLALVPGHERLVVVEDARELVPDHPHCVRLEGRPANAEGTGAITLTTLVRQALRMRPDRVVLGEVRGAELTDLLTALNTGHEGGCGTVHANSVQDVPARLEALAALGGLGREACHAQVAAALQLVVHLRRSRSGARAVDQIGLFRRGSDGLVEIAPAASFVGGRVRYEGEAGAELTRLVGW
ncbi:TadA family conjugal transfer-associated ATPase [Tessaracoccus sp. ZS01]|uniref:TadA family conjugal transfer-associated ATPase n=1 Tax=Tessaracoccus sp. ZS01 TaxID=1906324 RepID=UPI00096C980C|nr:TadA family conjugal transfer-associated ATPase [Tessaracoccus sp. ZS01]MCG6568226.1 pilus assembly protein CpaF [Tessaracoccus sp. ZS01]OMG53467.1 pilus assembly protein CpaF [Tessaracoccus sp. ZS01]